MSDETYAAIEAGGTKFCCAVGRGTRVLATATIPTTTPATTFAAVREFLVRQREQFGDFAGIGVASFGPLDLDCNSAHFGCIQRTPKSGWSHADMRAPFRALAPVAIDTDVNMAALGEALTGRGANRRVVAYATIGTGIGVGVTVDGRIYQGRTHPEIGHIPVRLHAEERYAGACPYHGNCLEGLASGPALHARWGENWNELPANHPAYRMEADYIAQLCSSLIFSFSPDVIVLGGGVMKNTALLPKIRDGIFGRLNGYVAHLRTRKTLDACVVAPAHPGLSATFGAFAMAEALVRGSAPAT